jgi:hypothetical protein
MTAPKSSLCRFSARIEILGINPFVFVPERHLRTLLQAAGRDRGPIAVRLLLAGVQFRQNLLKSHGAWRLYLNTPMRKALGKDVGDRIQLQLQFDAAPPKEAANAALVQALRDSAVAKAAFQGLAPSRKKEIWRYLNALKSEEARARNVQKVVQWLLDPALPGAPAYLRTTAR